MATITVKGVPDGLLARLRLAADGSGRTLSREIVVQLARSVRGPQGARLRNMSALDGREGNAHCGADRCVASRIVGWGGPLR